MNIQRTLLLSTVLSVYLFFPFEVGINLFAFDSALLLLLLRQRKELNASAPIRWATFCLLASAVAVVIVHSRAAIVAHHLSFVLLVGYAQRRELRFVWYALLLGGWSLLSGPLRAYREWVASQPLSNRLLTARKWGVPITVALLICLPFLLLYAGGNGAFLDSVDFVLEGVWRRIDLGSIIKLALLTVLGGTIAAALFYPDQAMQSPFNDGEAADRLERQRGTGAGTLPRLLTLYRTALLVFASVNVLLAFVNLTDLRFIWLPAQQVSAATLSEYVHAGTHALVGSMLLAMVLVLFFFRGSLNFYSRARPLRILVYVWLAQNAVLALSVGVRNWHYVAAYGLAFGRIHVAFALGLILAGLFSLYVKVRRRYTLRFVFQTNALVAWLLLVAYGGINWSGVITRINLQQPDHRIDWKYLVDDLDRENDFLLRREGHRLPDPLRRRVEGRSGGPSTIRGWNYADWRNAR